MISTALEKGRRLDNGFEILDVVELGELEALGIWARHSSGAQVFHILNDDRENLFAFAFATAIGNSTGVAHILEHSVLCGSRRYPCKDAFPLLEQGSLQTYLNAWTFQDKTVYPSSSVNRQDYFNLMSVYGDSVFQPLLSEFTFMQEGHRLTLAGSGAGEKLSITGVVYTEMKGAYSSLDSYAALWSVKSLFPGTVYDCDSGGDPECIPALSWEELKNFHAGRYSPANCRIFLAGNIPTEEQLDFISGRFLAGTSQGRAADPIPLAERWDRPRSLTVPCPMAGSDKAMVFVSWLWSDITMQAQTTALAALTEALLGHDGSPLARALVESGLGEDLCPLCGMDGELRETTFAAGLRGVAPEDAPKVEALILGELERIAAEGFPPEEIEAALLSMEFSHLEIRRSGGPFSLTWLRRSLRGWLHGAKPWDTLLFMPGFRELKARIAAEPRYLESLIRTWLLDNPHRILVTVEPKADFREQQERRLEEELAKKEAALSGEARRSIREKEAALEAHQNREEDPAVLASLPRLSRADLSLEIETAPHSLRDAGGAPVLTHDLFTNGITYTDLAIPVDILDPEDYPWLPFFCGALTSVGLPGMDYGEVSGLLARTVGGFHGILKSGSPGPGAGSAVATPSGTFDITGRDWIVYRLKCLDEKIGEALGLALRLITEADFSDERRIRDLVLEAKNEAESSLAPGGHHYATTRAARFSSRSAAVNDLWNGLGQIGFARRMAELDSAGIISRLNRIRDTLAARGGLIASFTGRAEALNQALSCAAPLFRPLGPPGPRNPRAADSAAFHTADLLGAELPGAASPPAAAPRTGKPEVFASPSLQIGFAAMILASTPMNTRAHAAELVLTHQLSTGPLWEDIRMKGGAYGAFAHKDSLERIFAMSTFRDPNPLRSLDSFRAALSQACPDGDALDKAIVGTYARETRPRSPAERGASDFFRFLYGLDDAQRLRNLTWLVGLQGDEIDEARRHLAAQTGLSTVIIAGSAAAEKAARSLGVEPAALPV
ncbi:MAG: insulinase family protein [Treponema sp.]|jgi:Zn-dependent M16 (insulinase) family peptidase|nr:insulinase family protein [Treponema sp.]